jgi:hypothetical protein
MYKEEREILLLQREKYKLKMIETLLETREKVVSTKSALTLSGTALAGFFAYKGINWFANKTKKNKVALPEKTTTNAPDPSWLATLKEQAVLFLLDAAKEQLQKMITKKK